MSAGEDAVEARRKPRHRGADTFGAPLRPAIAFNPMNPLQPLPDGRVPAGDTSYSGSAKGPRQAFCARFRAARSSRRRDSAA